MIISNMTVALGDCINTFPATVGLILKFKKEGPVSLHFHNRDLADLFPSKKYEIEILDSLPPSGEAITTISLHDYILGRTKMRPGVNFTQACAEFYNLNMDEVYSSFSDGNHCDINYSEDTDIPVFDFILCPFVLNNPYKNINFWQDIVDALHKEYGGNIGVLGKTTPPSDEDFRKFITMPLESFKTPDYQRKNFSKYLTGVQYFTDEPLSRVATAIKQTRKLTIHPDSGLMHLINLIKVPSVEVYTWCLIKKFSNSNGRWEEGGPGHDFVNLEAIMKCVREILG